MSRKREYFKLLKMIIITNNGFIEIEGIFLIND